MKLWYRNMVPFWYSFNVHSGEKMNFYPEDWNSGFLEWARIQTLCQNIRVLEVTIWEIWGSAYPTFFWPRRYISIEKYHFFIRSFFSEKINFKETRLNPPCACHIVGRLKLLVPREHHTPKLVWKDTRFRADVHQYTSMYTRNVYTMLLTCENENRC